VSWKKDGSEEAQKVGVADSRATPAVWPLASHHRSHAVHMSNFLTILVTSRAAYAPFKFSSLAAEFHDRQRASTS